jgi:hypothetical protein
MRSSIAVAALVGLTAPALAHIALTAPARRGQNQKEGPCGLAGSTRGTTTTTFLPGETITVEWDETVDHSGHYRIAFDSDGNDDFPNPFRADDAFPSTLIDHIPDSVGGGHYTQDVTLPDIECDNCTLQLMQIMSETEPYNSFYYQCADLVLARDTGGDDTGGDDTGGASGGCDAGGGSSAPGIALLAMITLALRAAGAGARSSRASRAPTGPAPSASGSTTRSG